MSPSGIAAESVQDLSYGVTLYHFYQQHYFDALTELTAAQQRNRLPNHADGAELLRGGMSLSYGMDDTAREVFERLLATPLEGVDRDRVWFYLGKLAWQRGSTSENTAENLVRDLKDSAAANLEDSAAVLARMAPDYTGPVADEANYLKAVQALAAGDESAAKTHLLRLQQSCPWRSYFAYNLGASRAAAGNWQQSAEAYRQLDAFDCMSSEGRALRDKAWVAAGFASLAAGDTDQAVSDFERVRMDGPESDRALLGYGWSFANQSEFLKALSPWQQLFSRPLVSASVRESLLAVPWAYEQLERPGLALLHYQNATGRYTKELERLTEVTSELQHGELAQLFGLNAGDSQEWLGVDDLGPQGEHAGYLTHLLSGDAVQISLRELRDLNAMEQQLQHAAERLAVLVQVDSEQQQSWDSVTSGGRAHALSKRRDDLASQAAVLRATLDKAALEGDGRVLADGPQSQRWQQLERAESLASLSVGSDRQAKLRLMRGLMLWRDSEDYPDRAWRLLREIRAVEALLIESDDGLAAVDAAVANRQLSASAQRIAGLQERTELQRQVLKQTQQQADQRMRQLVMAEMERQRVQLVYGLGQSRLAIARLYDRASPGVPR